MRDGHGGSTRSWSAVITHSTKWRLPSTFLTSGSVYIGPCSTLLLLGRSSLCLLAYSSLWRKPCRLQGLGSFPSLSVGHRFPGSGRAYRGRKAPCQWVIIFLGVDGPTGEGRPAAETSHSEEHTQDPTLPDRPYNEHTVSVSHTEQFPPSLAQPQASPQLQLTVSLARPH